MSRFTSRYRGTELIDEPGIPFEEWAICLKELNIVNTLLGGHSITNDGVMVLAGDDLRELTIAEIGCGGGDNLKAIARGNPGKSYTFIGIDINKACTDFAEKNCSSLAKVSFVCSDYNLVKFEPKPDIIFSSLFCHHFTDEQLIEMLLWLKNNSKIGFFINDLQRNPVAYHSIKILTKIFSRSYLVRNDGPVSVLRGFKKKEWISLLEKASIKKFSIKWRWAFRYLVIVFNE